LVGPFQSSPPFDLLIVNTDGTLAERSGNGLTIFSQALSDQGFTQR
jgi:diaminopimelate epimerase